MGGPASHISPQEVVEVKLVGVKGEGMARKVVPEPLLPLAVVMFWACRM